MFKLDENFLKELGLGELPPQEKNRMLAQILETLEMRVGMELAKGMSDEQLKEFEGFIGGDVNKSVNYLSTVDANWQQSESYQKALKREEEIAAKKGRAPNPDAVTSEHAALRWLETNFPGYKQVVSNELDRLKAEIRQAAPAILEEINSKQ